MNLEIMKKISKKILVEDSSPLYQYSAPDKFLLAAITDKRPNKCGRHREIKLSGGNKIWMREYLFIFLSLKNYNKHNTVVRNGQREGGQKHGELLSF